jgi:hypothetical protein
MTLRLHVCNTVASGATTSMITVKKNYIGEISGPHSGVYEDDCLLGCCSVWSGRSLPTFQRCLLPPSRPWWCRNAIFSPEDGDSMFLRNVGIYLRVYNPEKQHRCFQYLNNPVYGLYKSLSSSYVISKLLTYFAPRRSKHLPKHSVFKQL